MGLFDMFKSKNEEVAVDNTLSCAIEGKIIPIEEVPDPVFSQKMLGDGYAIEPANGEVVSPVNGKIVTIYDTKHAIGFETESGLEVLIHFGMDTIALGGEGFTTHVAKGDTVTKGQKILTVDLEAIRDKVPSVITPVVITNLDGRTVQQNVEAHAMVTAGQEAVIEVK